MFMFMFQLIINQDCLSVEGKRPANRIHRQAFCSCDLDLDPMTLKLEYDLNIPKTYLVNSPQTDTISKLFYF